MNKPICGTKQQQAKIKTFLADMQWLFGVGNFKCTVTFETKSEGNTAADITVDESYQRISICVYPLFFKSDESWQRQYLIHELCHFFIAPIQKIAENLRRGEFETAQHVTDAVEKSTSRCEKVILLLLENKRPWAIKDFNKYIVKKVAKKKTKKKK